MSKQEIECIPNGEDVEGFVTIAIPGLPEFKPGGHIGKIIYRESKRIGGLANNDILVVASKIVSKNERQVVDLSRITPSNEANELSKIIGKPPTVCQIILNESNSYIVRNNTIIARHKLGYVLTSAGVDRINGSHVSLIPKDPDLSAKKIREEIEKLSGKKISVVIADSEGREDRPGAAAVALGVSGIDPIRRTTSPNGKEQEETLLDMIANAASILIGQRGKNTPAVVIRGLDLERNIEVRLQDYLRK